MSFPSFRIRKPSLLLSDRQKRNASLSTPCEHHKTALFCCSCALPLGIPGPLVASLPSKLGFAKQGGDLSRTSLHFTMVVECPSSYGGSDDMRFFAVSEGLMGENRVASSFREPCLSPSRPAILEPSHSRAQPF